MSYPVFYVPAGDVLPIFFDTFAGSTGASITMSGLAVADIEVYKDGGVTQRASDAGYTLLDTDGIDFDGLTGIHGFSIDTGDNTDAGFYTVGAWFTVVVSAVTVDTQTVSFVAAQFRLMPAEGVAGKPKVDVDAFGGTAGTFSGGRPEVNTTHWAGSAVATPTVAGVPEVDVTHWIGTAAATPATAGYPAVTVKVGTGTGEINLSSGNVPIRTGIKKGAGIANFPFVMQDSTGAPLTGSTVTVSRSLDGAGTFTTVGTATEMASGWYQIDLAAGDTNGDTIALRFSGSGGSGTPADGGVTIVTEP